jgi:hypothetical protein
MPEVIKAAACGSIIKKPRSLIPQQQPNLNSKLLAKNTYHVFSYLGRVQASRNSRGESGLPQTRVQPRRRKSTQTQERHISHKKYITI